MKKKALNYRIFAAKTILALLLVPLMVFVQGQFFVSHAEPSGEVKTARARWGNLYYFAKEGWQPAMQQPIDVSYSGTGTVPADLNEFPSSFNSTFTYYTEMFGEGYDLFYVKWDNTGCKEGNVTLSFNQKGMSRYLKFTPFEDDPSILPDALKNQLDGTNQGTCISQKVVGDDVTLEFSVPADKVAYILYIASSIDMITYETTISDGSVTYANGTVRWGDFNKNEGKWIPGNNQKCSVTYSGPGVPIADLDRNVIEDDWAKTVNILCNYYDGNTDLLYIIWNNKGNSEGRVDLFVNCSVFGAYESITPCLDRGDSLPGAADYPDFFSYVPDFSDGHIAACVSQSITDTTAKLEFDVPKDCVCYSIYKVSKSIANTPVEPADPSDNPGKDSSDNPGKDPSGEGNTAGYGNGKADPGNNDSQDYGKNSYIKDAFEALDNISDRMVISIDGGENALTRDFFEKLSKLDCIVEYSVVVEGNEYIVIIDSKNIKWLKDDDYYGVAWLASNYPVKGKNAAVTKGEYIIKDGDTLNKIAADLNTTADDLANKNGIKNKNFIRAGAKLKY
ncbi:MAG: LysM peptidoglycan-binding domain-containing protein [Lachnospiraceae bacterium]|nr:LysM peptidoglycan-binding domain-containing protein [Lachnospiraceae bacterium]